MWPSRACDFAGRPARPAGNPLQPPRAGAVLAPSTTGLARIFDASFEEDRARAPIDDKEQKWMIDEKGQRLRWCGCKDRNHSRRCSCDSAFFGNFDCGAVNDILDVDLAGFERLSCDVVEFARSSSKASLTPQSCIGSTRLFANRALDRGSLRSRRTDFVSSMALRSLGRPSASSFALTLGRPFGSFDKTMIIPSSQRLIGQSHRLEVFILMEGKDLEQFHCRNLHGFARAQREARILVWRGSNGASQVPLK